MRRTASEVLRSLEMRVATLEKQSASKVGGVLTITTENFEGDVSHEHIRLSGIREIQKAVREHNLTRVLSEPYRDDEILLVGEEEMIGTDEVRKTLKLAKESIASNFVAKLGLRMPRLTDS